MSTYIDSKNVTAPSDADALAGSSQIELNGGDVRIPVGGAFDCEFELTDGRLIMVSDLLKPVPKQSLELAEGIKRALSGVHSQLNKPGRYHIKEVILALLGKKQATRSVALVQMAGEALPPSVVKAVVDNFFAEVSPAAPEAEVTRSVLVEVPNEDLDAMVAGWTTQDPDGQQATSAATHEPQALKALDEALVDVVSSSAAEFKRANRGKKASISVVTAAGTTTLRGEVPLPEKRWLPETPIAVVRQIDGLGISSYTVSFVTPGSDLPGVPTDPIALQWVPEKFDARIGQGEGSEAPPIPLLREVRELIGNGSLLVNAEVMVSEVRGRIQYNLVRIEPVTQRLASV